MEIEEMGAASGDEYADADISVLEGEDYEDEKIFVTVRLRPLNVREIKEKDSSEWECINDTTVKFKNSLGERSNAAISYTFDRVFGSESSTREVYEEAAKEIALSVVNGINSTIFAYGQTSSGKTYTMRGITEYAMEDIFDYIKRHHEDRVYVLKFSAIEIYNEAVRDLLSMDNIPLRVLDDPEKGTVVEKLTEVLLRDWNHLKELLAVCEAQRQIVETLMNESSSRSHQILKLTIESSACEFLDEGSCSALAASVSFVDLAGSERASQVLSIGNRLKEGGHINKSLLSLSTVIRKLSKGKHGHIPYRDSKLTRILQPSLGGNARTAVICTICPGRSNIEQSRSTLLFASRAKEVVTRAQVNVVRSDKSLVKQLRKELSRLEDEVKYSNMSSIKSHYKTLLKEKDAKIEKMETEIKELKHQRDLAQNRLEDLLCTVGNEHESFLTKLKEDKDASISYQYEKRMHTEEATTEVGDEDYKDQCKILRCIKVNNKPEHEQRNPVSSDIPVERLLQNLRERMNNFVKPYSNSGFYGEDENHGAPINGYQEDFNGLTQIFQRIYAAFNYENEVATPSRDEYQNSETCIEGESVTSEAKEVAIPNLHDFVAELKSASFHFIAQMDDQNTETSAEETTNRIGDDPVVGPFESPSTWSVDFQKRQQEIIDLWDTCSVSLVHRTYFFLLFKGDSSDSIYMEVELRRLSFLKKSFSQSIVDTKTSEGGQTVTMASSNRKLGRERRMLRYQMSKKFSTQERESLYNNWGIPLDSKQRKWQLIEKLWTKTEDCEHIRESAFIVGRLVGLDEPGHALKEMFGLTIAAKQHGTLTKQLSKLKLKYDEYKRGMLSLIK